MAEACPICGMTLPGTGSLGGSEVQILLRIEHLLKHLVYPQVKGQPARDGGTLPFQSCVRFTTLNLA
jgi:hypothetical protein